ncbi:shikimate dehydrogenase family protein [Falsiroseomonas sp. HW251]|uniref:shikimate dehydrogenase family protein n=1 Tax=Falsiroseomonas sp. HW251 TaxID=3390998 RepID=UPI003D311518
MAAPLSDLPSGTTRVVGIIGHPVAQVQAPHALTAHLRGRGVDAMVVPFEVAPDDLAPFLAGIARSPSLAGLVVTIPHKPAALAAARGTPREMRIGAANVLRRTDHGWEADMVDGQGFGAGLRAGGFDPAGRRVLLVGAGGVGAAIAVALADAGAAEIAIHDRDPARAAALAERVPQARAVDAPDASGCDLAVNATPLGMAEDDPLPFDPAALAPGAAVAEVVMKPAETRLLRAAAAHGLQVFPGRLVMEHQLPLLAGFLFPELS